MRCSAKACAHQQQARQRHAAALAARQVRHQRIAGRAAQAVHGLLQGAVNLPPVDGVQLALQRQ